MTTHVREAARWSRHLQAEVDSSLIYASMARSEREATIAAVYARLAAMEAHHARIWGRRLRRAGMQRPTPRPSRTASLLIAVAERLGPDIVGRSLVARERAERARYERQDDPISAALTAEERIHEWVLDRIAAARLSGTGMARLGNALRAAVLGMNDGLVANLSLLMGVAGAGADPHALVVAGVAGLLAGSLSMALGEYLSVQTSRELFQHRISLEKKSDVEPTGVEFVSLILADRGMETERARALAAEFVDGTVGGTRGRATKSDDLGDLGGSAWIASATSFAMFAAGAAVPLLAFALLTGVTAEIFAVAMTGAVLFANGSAVTLITGLSPLRAGMRQVAIGYAAAAITYGVGRLFNVATS
ncbi:MAG: VIT1/CCC1 transporter family protein [Chloroflexota bacterium]|nr:VIT1/CCC1 transporter family protein [Chloroflexota bacterium]MDE3193892.1 VIT1/CCC1 transporter family protein [Chloroflexota bacterium]